MSSKGWAAFAAMSLIWGVPYLFIKVAVDDGVSPVFLSFARVAIGAALLLALAWRAGVLSQLRGRWRWIAAYAIVEITLPFPLIAAGEQHVSSSLAAIIIAAAPLFVALLAIRFDAEERATGARLAGLLLGLAGVVAHAGRVLSGDTGVGHLATAFGVPSVLLFGPTPPAEWGPPPGRPQHVVLHRAGRGDPHGDAPDPRLLAITVEDVLEVTRRRFPATAAGTRHDMSMSDKITGRVKKAVGDLTDDADLRQQGRTEERKGEAKDEQARAEERAQAKAEEVEALDRRS
jgi:uncharacterized protein YjbJ (UPF0337 family)